VAVEATNDAAKIAAMFTRAGLAMQMRSICGCGRSTSADFSQHARLWRVPVQMPLLRFQDRRCEHLVKLFEEFQRGSDVSRLLSI